MAQEIRAFTFTVPANTSINSPTSLDVSFPPREVNTIEIVVPPGANGAMGFQIQNSGLVVIPYDSDTWIVANDEKMNWPLEGYINSGSWQLAGYNQGQQDHSVYVRFLLSLPAGPAAPIGTAPLDTDALSGSL